MSKRDRDYYKMRAQQEEAAANQASDPVIAAIHRAMAVGYLSKSLQIKAVSAAGSMSVDHGGDEDNFRQIQQCGPA